MLRLMGALFVLAGTSGFGHLIACGLDHRVSTLRRLGAALQHLESDIIFASLPLSAALCRAAQAASGEAGAFLTSVAEFISRNDGEPLTLGWNQSLAHHTKELLLTTAEIEVLTQLGKVLGNSDREDQQKHLALTRAELARFQAEAEAKASKTKRIWKYLGFALGALTVIFLY